MNTDIEFKDKIGRSFETIQEEKLISVKGKLKQKVSFWENTIKANEAIIDIIKEGYKIPFLETPSEALFKNNKSAIENSDFVEKSILEMLKTGAIKESASPPKVVNPLSVSTDSRGKKRFILDLRYINNYLYKDKIKFDDWKCFENYLEANKGYLFKFDLKSGYYHVDIFSPHQTYLGFSWVIGGTTRYFFFTVLPFGLSTAPFIFTKILRPLVKYWRLHAVKIAVFLDDGISIEYDYNQALSNSKFVRNSLIKAGFVLNENKSVWTPSKNMVWLGMEIDTNKNIIKITDDRITNILNFIQILFKKVYISARELSKLAGKIISTKFIIGNLIHLKTRNIFKSIESRSSWDTKFNIAHHTGTVKEIIFWKNNIKSFNKRVIKEYVIPTIFVYSDASNSGLASIYKDKGKDKICYKNFSETEKSKSSTWRELEAIRYSLNSSKVTLQNKTVFWYTDNYACSLIANKGSNKIELHDLALDIWNMTHSHKITLKTFWIPRENNMVADRLSKQIDYDDWYITFNLIRILCGKWGWVTVDRFASDKNKKADRFNSKYLCPGTERVNAFSTDWSNENNLLVPPIFLIPKTIKHFLSSNYQSRAILVCPYWPSATFWPLLLDKSCNFRSFIKDYFIISNVQEYIKLGDNKSSFIGSESFVGQFIAFQLLK